MSTQENNLIRGVALNNGQIGQIDYNFLANQPTINGQPAAGELSEVLALKGETSEIHTGSDEPPASAKVWIAPNGDEAVSLPETVEQVIKEYMEENPPESGIPIPSSAQVGQTIVVKSVDETGKPTEWEAADLPSGGGAEWKLIGEIITAEEVSGVSIVNDKPLNEMLVYYSIPPIPEDTGGTTYIMPKIIKNGVISSVSNVCRGVTKPNTKTERGRWHITALGGTIQEWSASVASPPNMFMGFREEGMLDILDAHKAGGGLIGFCINWNLGNKFPAGIKLEVWGR